MRSQQRSQKESQTGSQERLLACESYGRTDGLTEKVLAEGDQSETSVPRAGGAEDSAAVDGSLRFAATEPKPLEATIDELIDAIDGSFDRRPVRRTGPRPAICWHVRSMVKQRDDYRCAWGCSRGLLNIDHIEPWSAGGSHDTRNLQLLCEDCNAWKSNYPDKTARPRPGITVDCLRCRDEGPTRDLELVWCFTCREFSHDDSPRVDHAQAFLLTHCDQVMPPRPYSRDQRSVDRYLLLTAWQDLINHA